MLDKVKLFFGIEGLKADLDIPESFSTKDDTIVGVIRLHTKTEQTLMLLSLKLVETYQRGRGKDKRTNDYIWGSIDLTEPLTIPAQGEKIIDFKMPIKSKHSSIDLIGQKSKLHQSFTKMVKWVNRTKSEFFIELSTKVDGTALNPSVKKAIVLVD